MSTSLHTALTGMMAAQQKLNVSAYNSSNISTANFKKQDALLKESVTGVTVTIRNDKGDAKIPLKIVQSSSTDAVEESVRQISSLYMMKSNAISLKTADVMLGTTINIKK